MPASVHHHHMTRLMCCKHTVLHSFRTMLQKSMWRHKSTYRTSSFNDHWSQQYQLLIIHMPHPFFTNQSRDRIRFRVIVKDGEIHFKTACCYVVVCVLFSTVLCRCVSIRSPSVSVWHHWDHSIFIPKMFIKLSWWQKTQLTFIFHFKLSSQSQDINTERYKR